MGSWFAQVKIVHRSTDCFIGREGGTEGGGGGVVGLDQVSAAG
jgi:hypothetical protein